MLLAYFVYFFILIIAVGFGWFTAHGRQKYSFRIGQADVLIPVMFISLLMGFRYQVGTDWEQYLAYYLDVLHNGLNWQEITDSRMEPLYGILNVCSAFFNLPSQLFFALIMSLHLILLYKSFDRYVFLLPYGLFFYITTFFFFSLNGQRQSLAICVFFFSLRYIFRKDILRYMCCILIAFLIHYSSIILFPVYFLYLGIMKFLDRRWILLLLYGVSFFLFDYILNFIVEVVSMYTTNAKYLKSLSALGNWDMEVSSGLGILATHCVDVLLIIYSKKLRQAFQNNHFSLLFRIFMVGALAANIFGNDVFLSRLPLAMESLRFLMLAFLVYYLWNINKSGFNFCFGLALIILYLGMFTVAIYNGAGGCSPFQFA